MTSRAFIQGTLTIRQGPEAMRLQADGRRIDLRASSLDVLRDAARTGRLLREAMRAIRSIQPRSEAHDARPATSRSSASVRAAARQARAAGWTIRVFIGERLIAELGPGVEPNFTARLLRLAPLRLHAGDIVRSWLARDSGGAG